VALTEALDLVFKGSLVVQKDPVSNKAKQKPNKTQRPSNLYYLYLKSVFVMQYFIDTIEEKEMKL
jgi:hypothetical protein